MNLKIVIAAVAVVIIGIVIGVYARGASPTSTSGPTGASVRPLKTYYDQTYGIAFNFPDNYTVQEHDSTGEGTKHHTIVIGNKSDLESVPENGEGPPVMTIDIFANPGNSTAETWIKGTNESNFKLSPDSVLTDTEVSGIEALAYAWDGLYPSTSIVFARKNQIYMLSVGYNSPDDQIRKDFPQVVASIQFDP